MATYAIGDVQGCFAQLQQLLEHIQFNPTQDKLWFAGDLVNRGPDSLATLRWVKNLGERAVVVLGNHDLHLLACGFANKSAKRNDTLAPILAADDRDELLHWLRQQPLIHRDKKLGFSMIHAGLPPQWSLKKATKLADEVHAVLRGKHYATFLKQMYGNEPATWDKKLSGMERLRFITNCFTRLRYCTAAGELGLEYKGAPGSQPKNFLPWFTVAKRKSAKQKIIFGHWSTLGEVTQKNVFSLDTGCLWGGSLTALRLEDQHVFAVSCSTT